MPLEGGPIALSCQIQGPAVIKDSWYKREIHSVPEEIERTRSHARTNAAEDGFGTGGIFFTIVNAHVIERDKKKMACGLPTYSSFSHFSICGSEYHCECPVRIPADS